MERPGATPLYPEVRHAPDRRGLLLAIYISTALWAGLGLVIQALN